MNEDKLKELIGYKINGKSVDYIDTYLRSYDLWDAEKNGEKKIHTFIKAITLQNVSKITKKYEKDLIHSCVIKNDLMSKDSMKL